MLVLNRSATVVILFGVTALSGLFMYLNWDATAERFTAWYALTKEPEKLRILLAGWGPLRAPLAFIGLQILQVVFAPIPGEAGGLIGGYLFGTLPGFFYSTVGLAIGSVINFGLARILGRRYALRWIPDRYMEKFDGLTKRQGAFVFFLFFVFPGFPKDYLCIFLGLTTMPVKLFVPMAAIGRIPGTLMLSLQGAQVFQKDYVMFIALVAVSLAIIVPAYYWRGRIYGWTERQDGR
jgi:uncharacterized membrane protein YdjX (TVP38/TMEM64 family)